MTKRSYGIDYNRLDKTLFHIIFCNRKIKMRYKWLFDTPLTSAKFSLNERPEVKLY